LYASQLLLKRNEINDFTPECIKVIKQHDEEKGTELLSTLEGYLRYVGDPVTAALDLNIHRNTLLYRINKIKDLTGIDLENGDIRFNIQLYFKLVEYLKGKWK
ncbi:MAG: helix-turn-helix domain-containing protein, partial [Erysipelotrichales bacterium]|nr:helix-turn-helix domain-containing protein [Erysipelotrichales bacterium]